jgi:hypothetical protein
MLLKTREDRLRRHLARADMILCKTPARSWLRAHYDPGYMIVEGNTVVAGCSRREYELTIDEAEEMAEVLMAVDP